MKRISRIVLPLLIVVALPFTSCKKDSDDIPMPLIDYVIATYEYSDEAQRKEAHRDSIDFQYDENEMLIKLVGENMQGIEISYDDAGRVERIDMPGGYYAKLEYSPFILVTWDGNQATMQRYWDENEPSNDKKVLTMSNGRITQIDYLYGYTIPQKGQEMWITEGYAELEWSGGNLQNFTVYWLDDIFKSGFKSDKRRSLINRGNWFDAKIERNYDPSKTEPEYTLDFQAVITYDDTPNPFQRYTALGMLYSDEMFYLFLSENNAATIDITEHSRGETYEWTINFSTELNNEGFPTSITLEEWDDDIMWFTETWNIFYMD